MARRIPTIDELEERLGYAFSDKDLVARALTHVSASGPHYQRLEFLGDRVLGLAVAEMLYAAFPDAAEGDLSRRLSDLVRRETCAEVAAEWGVGAWLRLSAGEDQAGGRHNRTILADVCEAILGAVFLDGGYAPARALIERAFSDRMRRQGLQKQPGRDAKTSLQEWAQGHGLALPVYALVERSGPDHKPVFVIAARLPGLAEAIGQGTTKRDAEQDAAKHFLVREGVWKESDHEPVRAGA